MEMVRYHQRILTTMLVFYLISSPIDSFTTHQQPSSLQVSSRLKQNTVRHLWPKLLKALTTGEDSNKNELNDVRNTALEEEIIKRDYRDEVIRKSRQLGPGLQRSNDRMPGRSTLQSKDSIHRLANDLTKVLKQLRADENDPTIPDLFRKREKRMPAFTHMWTVDDWVRHNSRRRYLIYFTTLPTSRLLRRVAPNLTALIIWSVVTVFWNNAGASRILDACVLPLTPLSLISTFVAALLTLRSNQGLERLTQGRVAWGEAVLYTRDMAQLVAQNVTPKDGALALKIARHLVLFSWLLKASLRGKAVNGSDEDIVRCLLPTADADYLLSQRKPTAAILTRIRQILSYLEPELSSASQHSLEEKAQSLNHCIMTCERILSSPIPPLYSAHTGRLLSFYLFFLPLALRNALNPWGTIITTAAVGYAMLGLDEISHLLEQPFRLMPLYQLSKGSSRDVGDAFCCVPPSLDDESSVTAATSPMAYWP